MGSVGLLKNSAMVCAPLMATSVEQLVHDMLQAKSLGADLVEIRLDAINNFQPQKDLQLLFKNKPLPVLVFCRPIWEGNPFEDDANKQLEVLRWAKELGADYVELDLKIASDFTKEEKSRWNNGCKIITSCFMDNVTSKEDLSQVVARMQSTGADILKIVTNVNDITELEKTFHLLSHCQSIGAVNTIIRRPCDGKLIGYNTDCEASMTAIEDSLKVNGRTNEAACLPSSLARKLFVLVGAGGAGRALAFGAKSRGARIVIFDIDFDRAKALAAAVSGEALPYGNLASFQPEKGAILANATPIGMHPNKDRIPVPEATLKDYLVVFDAVYTPRKTTLLEDAEAAGAVIVSGVEMFLRQAIGQFNLFTGSKAPEEFMREIVMAKF